MYIGPWEVVGRKKDRQAAKAGNKLNKVDPSAPLSAANKKANKQLNDNSPKVEDFLPLEQVKTLYDNLEREESNRRSPKEKDNKTKENEEKKKQQKQQQQQQQQQPVPDKKTDSPPPVKEKPPKSVEEALNNMKISEIQSLLSENQTRFPDTPLVWLKALLSHFNSKIPIEKDDPVFTGRPEGYPLNIVPKNLRAVLEKSVESYGAQNTRLFYEYVLTAMAMEMAKGVPVVGYKIFVQLLAKHDHKLSVVNIPKMIAMRNSYQNRKPIAMCLLWCFNQGGRENLDTGLRVWHEVMAPMLEAKSYSGYILKILNDLLEAHHGVENLHQEGYVNVLDDIFSEKFNNARLLNDGVSSVQKLREIMFQNKAANYKKLFENLISRLNPKTPEHVKNEIIAGLISCILADKLKGCYSVWKHCFMKYLFASTELLSRIENEWDELKDHVEPALLIDMLSNLSLSGDKTKKTKGKDDKHLRTCNNVYEKLIGKMSVKSTRRGFPWKRSIVLFVLLASAIVAYDVRSYDKFEASATGRFLKDSGLLALGQRVQKLTKQYVDKTLGALEATFPDLYKSVATFSSPYVKLAGDVTQNAKNACVRIYDSIANYVTKTAPEVAKTVELYAPGLIEKLRKVLLKGVECVKAYSAVAAEKFVEFSVKAATWMKTNVFVGNFSPENLQKYASQAINSTQALASQTYDWVYQKVQTLSKVK